MAQTYYILWYRLDKADAYLIWISNDQDGVVVQPDGAVPSFPTKAAAHAYALTHNLSIQQERPIRHHLDAVARWLDHGRGLDIDCRDCLAAWNLFGDVSASTGGNFAANRKKTRWIYEKLFWGNNLPMVTPPGEHYTPVWSDQEVLILRKTLAHGLTLFRNVVQHASVDM